LNFNNKYLDIIGKLSKDSGYDAYIVGGYIRDMLLGLESNDVDILVVGDGIKFANICADFFNTKLSAVYNNFGTALLNLENCKIEFASARKESYSSTSRKPKITLSDLKDDLSRRDFTVNALAVSFKKTDKIIDLFDGIEHLKNKILKTPLNPEKTFEDDPLRMLRAIRFASVLNFKIEDDTFESIKKMKNRLRENSIVSQERITNEFLLILSSKIPSSGLRLLQESGIMALIFPEIEHLAGVEQINEYHHKDVFNHTLEVVDNISRNSNEIWLRLAALLHDVGKPSTKKFVNQTGWTFHGHEEIGARMIKNIFIRMKLPLNKLDYVIKLVRLHLRPIPLAEDIVTDSAIRRLVVDAGEDLRDLLSLCRADITSKNPEKVKTFLNNFDIVEKKIYEVEEKDKLRNFQSPVKGEEIMEICNLKPSKQVGIIKSKIEEAILEGLIPNDYEAAKQYLNKIKESILKSFLDN
jgi:putative nucleotidyltransferase with HDIG domain